MIENLIHILVKDDKEATYVHVKEEFLLETENSIHEEYYWFTFFKDPYPTFGCCGILESMEKMDQSKTDELVNKYDITRILAESELPLSKRQERL